MLRLVADENFNGDIVRALFLRRPDLDVVRVQDVGLAGADDPRVLAWAALWPEDSEDSTFADALEQVEVRAVTFDLSLPP